MRRNLGSREQCPAINELAEAIESVFPNITLLTTNNVTPASRHTVGLAIDIMLNVTTARERSLAHSMIDIFVARSALMLWSDLIYSDYDGHQISYFHIPARAGYGGPRGMLRRNPYTADQRHGDHIHLDYVDWSLKTTGAEFQTNPYRWSDAARTTGFRDTLIADFRRLPNATPAPTPRGGLPDWILGWWRVTWRGDVYYYFFERSGIAGYTSTRPGNTAQSIAWAQDTGSATANGNTVQVRWNATGSIERFNQDTANTMSGMWNDRERLTGGRI